MTLVPVRRALISVSDKSDLVPFARSLADLSVEIISTGGTAAAIAAAGVPVTPIDRVTGFPEILGGRVKTLHPAVHAGLLALRDDPDHAAALARHGFAPIDLVCINLYPFERTISRPGVDQSEAVEQIDIGGPAMIRSAAKNFRWVAVVTAPRQYDRVIGDLSAHSGSTSDALRADLAAAAFSRTAEYDAAIASYLSRSAPQAFPQVLRLAFTKVDDLRYGENPHQEAALYRDPASTGPTIVNARQLHGRALSYNNILDAAAALEVAKSLRRIDGARVGACVVKHTNPCGAGVAPDAAGAVDLALRGDDMAAYGGVLALNRVCDAHAARVAAGEGRFLEVIAAPEFTAEALDILRSRWSAVRLLATGDRSGSATRKLDYRSVPGGMLVQDRDLRIPDPSRWVHAAGPAPTPAVMANACLLVAVARALSSNAVAIGGSTGPGGPAASAGFALHGAGAGQMDRVAACRNAVAKAGPRAAGAIAASDAFFPFSDGPALLADAGVSVIVHPGGSKRDQDTLDLCNARGVTCLVTGVRHFRH